MKFTLSNGIQYDWKVEKIGVVGPGIVGMPMAAMLANARIKIGTDQPAKVCVIQRNSGNSGWKVEAINQGKSVIGGIEPGLNNVVEKNVKDGILSASWDFNSISDADVVLIAIQTDKNGFGPDYGPLFGGLTSLAEALQKKPANKVPLIVFESTLAPSSMATVIKDHFAKIVVDGQQIWDRLRRKDAAILIAGSDDDDGIDADPRVELEFAVPVRAQPILRRDVVSDLVEEGAGDAGGGRHLTELTMGWPRVSPESPA